MADWLRDLQRVSTGTRHTLRLIYGGRGTGDRSEGHRQMSRAHVRLLAQPALDAKSRPCEGAKPESPGWRIPARGSCSRPSGAPRNRAAYMSNRLGPDDRSQCSEASDFFQASARPPSERATTGGGRMCSRSKRKFKQAATSFRTHSETFRTIKPSAF
jgi:hypothetical protein